MPNFKKYVQFLAILPISVFTLVGPVISPAASQDLLSQHEISLQNRWPNKWVNQVFADNILLNLDYLKGDKPGQKVNWDIIKTPTQFEFTLNPNQTFAFHDDILPKYQNTLVKTTNAHFNAAEGFRSDGYLFGDGVCHLASLIKWVAEDARLNVEAPNNHDFAKIPDIPRKYGVSIYSNPFQKGANALENLYVTNNKDRPITFKFDYNQEKVKVSIVEN